MVTSSTKTVSKLSDLSKAFEEAVENKDEAQRKFNNLAHDYNNAKVELDKATDGVRAANADLQNYLGTQMSTLPGGTPINTVV